MKCLAIITTHPIQYNAPFFKLLAERGKVYPKVFYTWPQAIEGFDDPDFGKEVKWDIPLLDGYQWEAVENKSKNPSSKSWSGIDCPDLIKKVSEFDPDAVMVYGWNLKSHFKTIRYFKGRKPVWFFGDSTLLDEQAGWRKVLRRAWLTLVYRYINKAFYVGTNNKAYFQAHGLQEDQLVFFPNAVDNERFQDSESKQYEIKAQKWRKQLGYSEEDIVLLFAGKFESKKNPELLIKVIKQINTVSNDLSTYRPIHLLITGNGPSESRLLSLANKSPNIKFLPFQNQSQMPIVYRLGDIFCLPSQGPGETWGLAVNEAMACSRPVLVSDKVGCAIDLVIEGQTGATFESGNVVELATKLTAMLNNDLKKLGIGAQRKIQEWSYSKKWYAVERSII